MTKHERINTAMAFAKKHHDEAGQTGYFEKHIMRCYEIAVAYFMNDCPDTKTCYKEIYKYKAADVNHYRAFAEDFNCETLIAVILHDVLEDTKATYEEVAAEFGLDVAFDVQCLTDEAGANRKERKLNTYWKIRCSPTALFAKLIDRIANVEQSSGDDPKDRSYLNMYMKEYYSFKCALWGGPNNDYESLWKTLDHMHGFNPKK